LSARHHAQEAAVLATAGTRGAVTVATTMAGRGVDIRLGGDPTSLTTAQERAAREERAADVRSLGGLAVIAVTRFSSRRADLQLRGRCGRQGDPGVAMAFVAADDDVVSDYAGAAAAKLLTSLSASVDGELTSVPSMRAIVDRAQERRESLTAAARKDLLEYDLPIRVQLDAFYRFRRGLTRATADTVAAAVARPVWRRRLSRVPSLRTTEPAELATVLGNTFAGEIPDPATHPGHDEYLDAMLVALLAHLDDRFAVLDGDMEERARLIRAHLLSATDLAWAEHLEVLDAIRSRVSLATYAGIDPHDLFAEQAREAFETFSATLLERLTVLLLSLRLEPMAS
jgi:preprotein translocase subunit SecA